MTTYYKQDCPLCDTEAEYYWVDRNNRKYFQCPSCTFFQISKRAEEVLAEKYKDRKPHYASQAPKAPNDHLLVIQMPDHKFRQHSDDKLQVAFVAKSELPLQ